MRLEWGARFGLVVGSIFLSLVMLELGCRAWRGDGWLFDWTNLTTVGGRHDQDTTEGRYSYDPLLGAVPTPFFSSPVVTYDDNGQRVTPMLRPGDGPRILAAGDSFTEGDEVAGDQTWPAYLEQRLGRRTFNAGVNGYGFDQIVLRTEQQAAAMRPSVIVVSFMTDDLQRSEWRRLWGVNKPYFELDTNGELVLRNVPVPPRPESPIVPTMWHRLFGWSVVLEIAMRRLGQHEMWLGDRARGTPRGTGERLACPLVNRLARLGVPTLLVAQYSSRLWSGSTAKQSAAHRTSQQVLACAAAAGLATLDTWDAVEKVARDDVETIYLDMHHSAQGNRLIAEAIATKLAGWEEAMDKLRKLEEK